MARGNSNLFRLRAKVGKFISAGGSAEQTCRVDLQKQPTEQMNLGNKIKCEIF